MNFVHISSIIEIEFRCKLWVGDYWSVRRNLAAHGLGRIQCAFDGKGTPDHMAQDVLAGVINPGAVSVLPTFNRPLESDLGARCVPESCVCQ